MAKRGDITLTALKVLNDAFHADPVAMEAMLRTTVRVNEKLTDHPTIQVRAEPPLQGGQLSALGVINGILAANGCPMVAAQWDLASMRLVGFCLFTGKAQGENQK